jgi:glycosyltransferase involved in cell wall biosynthesis
MRVLFVIHAPADPATAVFLNVSRRAEHLRLSGHSAEIITPADVGVPRMSGIWPLLYPLFLIARGRLLRHDVVAFHSHAGWPFFLFRWFLDPRRRITAVTVFHGLEPLYHEAEERELARSGRAYSFRFRLLHRVVLQRLLAACCRRSDAVLCLNSVEREYLIERRWCEPKRVVIIANGVESELLRIPRVYESDAHRLLFVAQWRPLKGTQYLVRAFTTLAERHPHLRLICAGTGAPEAVVRSEFPSAIRDRVDVYPRVTRLELAGLLRAADLFAFPSLFEGFSGALLEAMAAGLPIVATRAGAAADMLEDGGNALVIDSADAAALAAALDRLLADAPLRKRLGESAQRDAATCDWMQVNALFTAVLAEVERNGSASGDRRPCVKRHDLRV